MKCPHCRVEVHVNFSQGYITEDCTDVFGYEYANCPACKKMILFLIRGKFCRQGPMSRVDKFQDIPEKKLIYPKGVNRPPCPSEVPKEIAEDYQEACLVLSDSPKASAALSRRCLQNLLRTVGGIKHQELSNEIKEIVDRGGLPTHISEAIDAVRVIGNFAAHPQKDKGTGEILPVEPEEAEWNLDVLESLFDFYYVQPALTQKKKDALNAKLQQAGKNPIK